jgi:FSR family fosmidomycin resistance protein-like MFS transporter
VVYAQELMPSRIGAVAGLFFGFAFGMAGIGAAVLGELADVTSIQYVFHVCSFLPVIGLLAGFLPHLETESRRQRLQTVAVDMTGNVDAVPPRSAK